MHIVYWAHSYRDQDAAVNRHFGILIEEAAKLIVNFDPPSKDVNPAKLEQNFRSCDGMVAVLTWRETGLRARRPLLVFVDDRLPDDVVPPRILQRRFSHRTYFRQVREHTHALMELRTYMGEQPGPRYQPSSSQRTCGLLGLRGADGSGERLRHLVASRGYRPIDLETMNLSNPFRFRSFEHLACLDVTVRCADSRSARSLYWAGALYAAVVPAISFTMDASFRLSPAIPREFQPRLAHDTVDMSFETVMKDQFELFEQDFLSTQDPAAIERYTRMQVDAGVLAGRYETETRNQFTEVIMGDKNVVSGQAGAVGSGAHAHDMTFNQIWNQLDQKVDLPKLADQLQQLQDVMQREASTAEDKIAVGAVAAAEQSAREKNGPKVVEYLKLAGRWALTIAEKLGIELAKDTIKGALGMK